MLGITIALIVVAILLVVGIGFMVLLIMGLTKNQTEVDDASGSTLTPVKTDDPEKAKPKKVPSVKSNDLDGISVHPLPPPEKDGHISPPPPSKSSSGSQPSITSSSPPSNSLTSNSLSPPVVRDHQAVLDAISGSQMPSAYKKSGEKVKVRNPDDDDDEEHKEGMPKKVKLPPTTTSVNRIASIEKVSEKEKKSKEIILAGKKAEAGKNVKRVDSKELKESSKNEAKKEEPKKPIVPGDVSWIDMKKQMNASESPKSPSKENLYPRDSQEWKSNDSLSIPKSDGSSGNPKSKESLPLIKSSGSLEVLNSNGTLGSKGKNNDKTANAGKPKSKESLNLKKQKSNKSKDSLGSSGTLKGWLK